MLSTISRLIQASPISQNPYHFLVPIVLERLGSDIAAVASFEDRLLPAIEATCTYIDDQIASIPGGIALAENNFYGSPVLPKLFGETREIGEAIGRSLEVKTALSQLSSGGHEHVFGLLGMRPRKEPKPNSVAPMFGDHTIITLAPTEMDARKYLRFVTFMRIIGQCMDGNTDPSRTKIGFAALPPDKKLSIIEDVLATAPHNFRTERTGFSVRYQQLGAMSAPVSYEFPRLHCADRRQWTVCFVQILMSDAQAALEREPHKHRYILI